MILKKRCNVGLAATGTKYVKIYNDSFKIVQNLWNCVEIIQSDKFSKNPRSLI